MLAVNNSLINNTLTIQPEPNFLDLPNEIIQLIFKEISSEILAKFNSDGLNEFINLRLVNKIFNAIVKDILNDPEITRHVTAQLFIRTARLSQAKESASEAERFFRETIARVLKAPDTEHPLKWQPVDIGVWLSSLHEMGLNNLVDYKKIVLDMLSTRKDLKSVYLENTTWWFGKTSPLSNADFLATTCALQKIVENYKDKSINILLNFNHTQLRNEGIQTFINILNKDYVSIEQLHLYENGIDDKVLEKLACLPGLKALKHLNLMDNIIKGRGIEYLSEALKENRVLCRIYFSYNPLHSDHSQSLVNLLKNKPIEALSLQGSHAAFISRLFQCLNVAESINIRKLNVSYSMIDAQGMQALDALLDSAPRIQNIVGLETCEIDSPSKNTVLAKAFKHNQLRQTLNVNIA